MKIVPVLNNFAYLYLHAASLVSSCLWRLLVAVGRSTDTIHRPSRRRVVSRLRRLLVVLELVLLLPLCGAAVSVVARQCVPKRDPNGDEVYRSLKESWKDFVC